MSAPLTTRIAVRDQRGNVIEEKEVATYAGLLARAHEEGLKTIATALVQVPTPENGLVAIATAVVETSKGRFAGIGDASPENVNRRIVPHLIRMSETRAKARALRDATNIGVVCLEELGGDDSVGEADDQRAPANIRSLPRQRAREQAETQPDPMSEAQKKYLFRLLTERGHEPEELAAVLCMEAGVASLGQISKVQASELIGTWTGGQARRGA